MFACLPATAVAAAITCPAGALDEHAVVEAVYDGDTVRLADGRSVRLVGINTPELGHGGRADQPLARAARRALLDLVGDADRAIGLEIAPERKDHYGRLLAHVYTADGRSVTAALLAQGLGWPIAIPPNLGHLECYQRAAAVARSAGRGVHAEPAYTPIPAGELGPDAGGYTRVRGTIERVGTSRRAYWLDLGGLTLRLAREDLPYFGEVDPRDWLGRSLHARGWIYRVHGEARMNLHHPQALEWTDPRQ